MASLKLKALSPWKKVKVNNIFDTTNNHANNNPEFEGFGGLEILEDYEYDILDHQEVPVKANRDKKKKSLKRQVASLEDSAKESEDGKNPKKKTRKEKQTKKKRKKIATETENKTTSMDSEEEANNISIADDVAADSADMDGWKGLFVPPPVLKSLSELGFKSPTLIQALTLPAAIRDRQDILGAAETGSGKTLAFGIPVIDKILKLKNAAKGDNSSERGVYALVLTPTRELCVQVRDHLSKAAQYTNISVVAIFGGMSSQKQVRLLKSKPEVIVATPGRLWDIMNSEEDAGSYLSTVVQSPLLVIDEADKMVEKGHFEELTKILTLMKGDEESSRRRQCFVFSATLTYVHLAPDRLAKRKKRKRGKNFQISKESKLDDLIETVGILKRPKIIDITEKSQTASNLVESTIFCTQNEKDLYLYYFLQRHPGRTLIFTNSIDCIRRLLSVFSLLRQTLLPLHASMHQKQRLKNLERFTASDTGVLLATDVAARGLDIPNIQHVIHYQVPRTSESYVHRSGRTARALKDGLSVVFVDEKDIQNYKRILKSLDKDDTLSTFPVDQSDLRLFKPIVSLAQRIDSTKHKTDKAKRHDDWFVKMAKEADLEISDDSAGSDMEQEEQHRQDVKERRKLDNMKSQLAEMLAEGGSNSRSYRGKYPTVSGKLEVPKTVSTKKDTQAITLVSRKRR